jgi:peptidoglycan glycosyltransferase
VLFARQFYVQVIAGPRISLDAHNPRTRLLSQYRGRIVARDGTVLALSGPSGREYPYGPILAHAVGYASDRYGTSGLEAAFDRELSAHPVSNDPFREIAQLIEGRKAPLAIPGATVVTTIDPAVQTELYEALQAYPRAAGIALDPRTGEVLAIASVPSFDPASIDTSFAQLSADRRSPLLDRALDGLYPPGSTFKIFTAAAALAAGTVTMDSTFEDPGFFKVGNFLVHDDEGEATGTQNLSGAFALSSNVDFAQIALDLGPGRWYDAASQWKLGEPVDFTLETSTDRLPPPATMSPGVLAQLGFGQANLLVTPMRMALVGATVASGGAEPRPYLVRSVRYAGGEDTTGPGTIATPISSDVAGQLREMMIATVQRGTGTAASLPGVQVAGKTGTATNPAGTSHAWFVAFAPAEAPRVAVAIVVENAGYGGAVAAPIARRVIAAALAHEHS